MDIEKIINDLGEQIFGEKENIKDVLSPMGIRHKKVAYGHRAELLENPENWDEFEPGSFWGEPDGHELFRMQLIIPDKYRGKEVFLFVGTGADDIWNTDNPQMLVYVNGVRRSGMDMNHNSICVFFRDDWEKGADTIVDVGIYAYSNLSENGNYLKMEIGALNETVKDAYFDLLVPFEAAKEFKEAGEDTKADVIIRALEAACNKLSEKKWSFDEASLLAVSDYLKDHLYGTGERPSVVASVGHTHIDVAWKWPLRQTREKVVRSFSTVMELMKRYEDYLFMASTPQLYEFVRQEEPELFKEVSERIREGRFEIEGAMWLEPDCNLTSGESLVRQILYGKEYMRETFGVESGILWLPDVFGYNASMPQIMKKSGIRAFVTTKLAWNDTNRMPYDFFWWKGIDGSRIPVYIITTCDYQKADRAMKDGGLLEYTYNGRQNASQIMGAFRAFREKDKTDEILTVFGFGDGGGGPTWEMLEMDRRLRRGIPGVPVTRQRKVADFMDDLLATAEEKYLPEWNDELYLEYHRGTYTSIGKNKLNNRRLEYLLREAELVCTYRAVFRKNGYQYPMEEIKELYKVLMLNQFHDILPGSSIEEVYKDSDAQYEEATKGVRAIIDEAFTSDEQELCAHDRAFSDDNCKSVITYGESGDISITTPYYRATINKMGEIESLLYNETDDGESIELRDFSGSPLGRLIAFEDKPKDYDAWNIDADFENVYEEVTDVAKLSIVPIVHGEERGGCENVLTNQGLSGAEPVESTSCVILRIERHFRSSIIYQDIVFRGGSPRIDYRMRVDWHEHQTLLKAAFPVNICSKEITCEIQYGNLKRSLIRESTWDKAKFECCAHRWIDISDQEKEYGVALLNDCKYGYDAREKLMRLTLIKSGIFPNPNADQGIHEFTYSLFPHRGDYRKGQVIEEARRLNDNAHVYAPYNHGNCLMEQLYGRFIKFCGTEQTGVYTEVVKTAEDGNGIILRLYEGHGMSHQVKAELFAESDKIIENVWECDLMENKVLDMTQHVNGKSIEFEIEPFEIKTFRVIIKN